MTKHVLTEELIYEILSVVAEIPAGSVASYGQIARLIGRDRNARLVGKVLSMAQCYGKYPCHRVRLVGKVLSMAQCYGKYPCHRVVNSAGRTAPGWARQRALLEQEGVQFKPNGCVDMT